jgi:hypothetical protein
VTEHFPAVGFELLEGVGPFCKLHGKAPGKKLDQSKVEEGPGVWLEKVLDLNGGKPYVIIPFLASKVSGGQA